MRQDGEPAGRIFVTCDIGADALARLQRRGYVLEVYPETDPPPYDLLVEKVSSGIVALVTTLRDRIDEPLLTAGKGTLKVVAQDAVGFDNIDRKAASRLKIPFTHTPDVLTDATAEFALFMMGSVARCLYSSERLVREKQWKPWHPYLPFLGDEVAGKTVAIIGVGRIGRAFAQKCLGLDVDLLLHNRSGVDPGFVSSLQKILDLQYEEGLSGRRCRVKVVTLAEALGQGDFVSIHLPLNDSTRALIDREKLGWMKPTAFLINSARGPIVDEAALLGALNEGSVAGAALDVFEVEPLPEDSALRAPELAGQVRLFHHFGSGGKTTRLSPDSQKGMAGRCVQGVIDVLEGRYGGDPARMPYVVNKEAFAAPS